MDKSIHVYSGNVSLMSNLCGKSVEHFISILDIKVILVYFHLLCVRSHDNTLLLTSFKYLMNTRPSFYAWLVLSDA
jgi:hypothetical protein